MAMVKTGVKMRRTFLIAAIGVSAIGVALVLSLRDSRTSPCESVVEFTYSRTQPCNAEYYNYGFSIGPLRDRILCWSGSKGASQLDFHSKVMTRIKTFLEVSELHLADEIIAKAISCVEFSLVKDIPLANPIKCRMIVRVGDKRLAGPVVRAFALTMADDLELENKSMSWKATMDKGCLCKRKERELAQLRKRISDSVLSEEETAELKTAINSAEQSLNKAKSLWEASIIAYREKWDASIVFLGEPNPVK